eukprot:5948040-Prymnesium_polylepis.1
MVWVSDEQLEGLFRILATRHLRVKGGEGDVRVIERSAGVELRQGACQECIKALAIAANEYRTETAQCALVRTCASV